MKDQPQLFDDPTVREPTHEKQMIRKRGTCTPDPLGSGPEGETCSSCVHSEATVTRSGKRFYKCGLMREYWTRGGATDIRLRWESCRSWEPYEYHYLDSLAKFRKETGHPTYTPKDSLAWFVLADWFREQGRDIDFQSCAKYAAELEQIEKGPLGETGG